MRLTIAVLVFSAIAFASTPKQQKPSQSTNPSPLPVVDPADPSKMKLTESEQQELGAHYKDVVILQQQIQMLQLQLQQAQENLHRTTESFDEHVLKIRDAHGRRLCT